MRRTIARRLSYGLACLLCSAAALSADETKQDSQQKKTPTVTRIQVSPPVKVNVNPQLRGDLQRKTQLFDKLRSEREKAAATAQAAKPAPVIDASAARKALQAKPLSSRVGTLRIDPAKKNARPSTREELGWTYKYGQGTDCNDTRRDIHPGASEICDNLDNNCDGIVDEGQKLLFFLDADGDGHGDPARRIEACPADQRSAAASEQWLVPVGNDCNDADPERWRGCP